MALENFETRFKIFHELMARKVEEVLLVSTPYDAWILEEDGRLSERIVNEYRGLNLSKPPRLTWVSSVENALGILDEKSFDMVVTMPCIGDTDAHELGKSIKRKTPGLPVMLLSHGCTGAFECHVDGDNTRGIDRVFRWTGDSDILLALIKSVEDAMNVERDAEIAGIRVILFVEDSPDYASSLLPILYKELVRQTQEVLEGGLNEEHRLLTMRARPKILLAETYEEAQALFKRFEHYVLGVISDVRYPRGGRLDGDAGVRLLSKIKKERFDIPLLMTSSEPDNAKKASRIPARFVDKNSDTLKAEVAAFLKERLGFGDFVFRTPEGDEIGRASSLRSMEKHIRTIPDESFVFHCNRNDFSRWLFARTETLLASKVRLLSHDDFESVQRHRHYLADAFHERRKHRRKGVVVRFDIRDFDPDTEFFKIGGGSLGGKARGLAYMSSLLHKNPHLFEKYPNVDIAIPQTLVITTDGFETFVEENDLRRLSRRGTSDEAVEKSFLTARFPSWIEKKLRVYLADFKYPLAVRSSSLFEDAQYQAYAGLYRTCMIANDHPDLETRLSRLIEAIKLVWASTYFQGPKSFSKQVGQRIEEEQMAVIVQKLSGNRHGDYFYPMVAGVAQSRNYYPFSKAKSEDGVATIALGFGSTVMEGGKALRFCPKYPDILPQSPTTQELLRNSQRYFYALPTSFSGEDSQIAKNTGLEKREIDDAVDEEPVRLVSSEYLPGEKRIRDSFSVLQCPVATFSRFLKHGEFPLPELLSDFLSLGEEAMGMPVEIEFSANMEKSRRKTNTGDFAFLQIRPMTARAELGKIEITDRERQKAFCVSTHALGNTDRRDLADIVYVKPDAFDPAKTPTIAQEIGKLNSALVGLGRKYLLIGFGRWGSADRWLGIPVAWPQISAVGAMVEIASDQLRAEPSQGSHFFHNITTMGINYVTVADPKTDRIEWPHITALPVERDLQYVSWRRPPKPIVLKVNGTKSLCVMY